METVVQVSRDELTRWADLVRALGLAGITAAREQESADTLVPEANVDAIRALADLLCSEITAAQSGRGE